MDSVVAVDSKSLPRNNNQNGVGEFLLTKTIAKCRIFFICTIFALYICVLKFVE